MYIGLISDTHGVFSDEFKRFLEPVDTIWHAGDWGGDPSFEKTVSSFKPVVGVFGNCDSQDIRSIYPKYKLFDCEGLRVLMTHIGGSPNHYDREVLPLIESYHPKIFVCGHSHILKVISDRKYDMLYLNPGAAGIEGWHIVRTALRFHVRNGGIDGMEVFELPRR